MLRPLAVACRTAATPSTVAGDLDQQVGCVEAPVQRPAGRHAGLGVAGEGRGGLTDTNPSAPPPRS